MRGAALPGLFRKLLDKPRLASWADVILGRRGQARVISGQGRVGVCVWGGGASSQGPRWQLGQLQPCGPGQGWCTDFLAHMVGLDLSSYIPNLPCP